MAVVVSEIFSKSESGSINATGARTITRKFHVTGTTVRETALAATAEGLPALDDTTTIGGETATFYGTRSWSRPDGMQDTWVLEYEYTTAPSGTTATVEFSGDTRASTKAVYRRRGYWSAPSGGWDEPTPVDIGGDPVDAGGTPTTIVSLERRFEIVERRESIPPIGEFDYLVGHRNDSVYQGGEAGTILYLGMAWSYDTTANLWVLRHQFAVDQFTYHAEQVAKTDPQGEVLTKIFEVDGEKRPVAKHIYWVQPFVKASFGDLPVAT